MAVRFSRIWPYQNTTLLILSVIAFFLLADTPFVHAVIARIGTYGYLGAAFAGMFFVSTFTVAPASVVLFHIAQEYNPLLVALSAGVGAVLGDLFLFRFVKDLLLEELRPALHRIEHAPVLALFHSPYFGWLTPVIGAIIIASPLPDEVGVGMMGLSKIRAWQFIVLTFVLNVFGIFTIILLARVA